MTRRALGWMVFAMACAALVVFAPDGDDVVAPIAPRSPASTPPAVSPPTAAITAQPGGPSPRLATPGYLAPAPGRLADAAGGLLPSVAPAKEDRPTISAKDEPAVSAGPELKAYGRIRLADRWLVSLALGDEEGLVEADGRFAGRFQVVRIEPDHVVVRTEPDGKQSIVSFAEAR